MLTAKKLILLHIFILVSLLPVSGSWRPSRHVALPVSDLARVLAFDGQGYLWIGTASGLLRYDGYQFAAYRNTMAQPRLLSDNGIEALATDGKGNLWIGTDKGITRLNMRSGTTRAYLMGNGLQDKVSCIYVTSGGTVLAGTERGVLQYDPAKDRFWLWRQTERLTVKSIVGDGRGNLFLGTWKQGLFVARHNANTLRKVAVAGNNFFYLKADSRGRLWTASWSEGIKLITSPASPRPQVRSFAGSGGEPVYNIVFGSRGTVYACSRTRLFKISPSLSMTSGEDGSGEMYSYIATNGTGTIAVLKKTGGVDFYSTYASPLRVIDVPAFGGGSMRGDINSLATADGNAFWLLSRTTGVSLFDLRGGRAVPYTAVAQLAGVPGNIKSSSCYSSLADSKGNVWIGNEYGGVAVIRADGRTQTFNQASKPWLRESGVCSMMEDRSGRMWFGQKRHVAVLNPDGSGSSIPIDKYVFGNGRAEVTAIMQDHRGRVWVCTRAGGVLRIDHGRVTPLNRGNGRYMAQGATACVEDRLGNIFFITSSGELLRWDNARDRSMSHDEEATVSENKFYAAMTDAYGNVWLSATNYLMRLRYANDGSVDIRRFYPARSAADSGSDNMHFFAAGGGTTGDTPGIIFLENAACRHGDTLYFASADKIVAVDTRRVDQGGQQKPKLALTDVVLDGHPYATLDSALRQRVSVGIPAYAKAVTVPYGIRRVEMDIANLDFANEGLGRYAYRLDGYNRDWQVLPAGSHSVTFENLPAGRYTLRVRCTDNSGQWAEMPYTVALRVLPPWWQTWWAYIIYIMLAATAVWAAVAWYRQRVRTQNKLQIARVFTNITHELLTPLSVVAAAVEAERSHVGDDAYAVIHNNMVRLVRLIRQILEVDKLNSGRLVLRVSDGDLPAFLRREADNMQPLAAQRGISISFSNRSAADPGGENPGDTPAHAWFDPDKLDKIVYNLLSNAVKYTPAGGSVQLSVSFDNPGHAVISVADNGIGISRAKLRNLYTRFMDGDYRRMRTMGTGIGLSLTRDLVALHHGTISCDSREGSGTTFTVAIPIDRKSYDATEIDGERAADTVTDIVTARSAAGDNMHFFAAEVGGTTGDTTGDTPASKEYTILIVEDNADLLDLMARELSKAYNTLRAANGQQALNVLARSAVDVVVSDVMMPVMDGIELTRRIKGNDDYAMLPVLLLTAKVRGTDRNEGYRVGADDYLTKPFSMETLRLRIDNFIANRERIRRKFRHGEQFLPEPEHYSDPDRLFVERCVQLVRNNIDSDGYGRDQLAADLCMSGSTLYKKLRALTGESVTGFINSIRLKESCRVMRGNPRVTVAEVCMRVGYNSPSYFHRLFKQEYGMTPTEFMDKVKQGEA